MTPAIAALVIGGILLVAGVQGRNVLDVALGREGRMAGGSPDESLAGFSAMTGADAAPSGDPLGSPAPGDPFASKGLSRVIQECNRIEALRLRYVWGGGHGGYPPNGPFDCSGAVSYVLHSAGLLSGPPRVSGLLALWGQPGPGQHLTVWANVTHVFLEIDGRMWGTSRSNPGGGPGWHPRRSTAGFTPRHHPGL